MLPPRNLGLPGRDGKVIVCELGAAMITVLSIVHGARDIDAMEF